MIEALQRVLSGGERIGVMIRKEFRQSLREPRMRVLLFVPPLLQLLVFGYAVNLDVEDARIAWTDLDRSAESRELLAAFVGSGRFRVVSEPVEDREVQNLIDRGDIEAAIRVLPGFSRDILRGRTGSVQILVEGSNSTIAALVSSYAMQVAGMYAAQVTLQKLGGRPRALSSPAALGRAPTAQPVSRVWFNPELRSRNYFVPGVVVNIIMIVTLMLTALSIVREKEIGTLEQLMVSPIRPIELMIGKTVPFALIGLFDMMMVTSAALLVFHIPFRGSALLLLGCSVLFLLTTLGGGLFLSTISQTQQQAVMSAFFFTMPCSMLSGFMFPIRNMPGVVRALTYLNPMRYFMEIVRGIFLKGVGLSILWPQVVVLAVFGVSVVSLSAMRFRKRLD